MDYSLLLAIEKFDIEDFQRSSGSLNKERMRFSGAPFAKKNGYGDRLSTY